MVAPHYLLSLHQWGERLFEDQRLRAVLSKPGVVTEMVVHPGYTRDPDLPLPDQLPSDRRQAEGEVITSPASRQWLGGGDGWVAGTGALWEWILCLASQRKRGRCR